MSTCINWISCIFIAKQSRIRGDEYSKSEKVFAEKFPYPEQNVIANKCEWFFKDTTDNWVKYGQSSHRRDESYVVTALSKQFEDNFFQYPRDLFHIGSKKQKYAVDFKKMVQMNTYYKTERNICRKIDFSSLEYFQAYVKFYWYFLDENHHWILYGNTNGNVSANHVTQPTDYIESEFNRNPRQVLIISSAINSYSIDFSSMTQTNLATYVKRHVCRIQFNPN